MFNVDQVKEIIAEFSETANRLSSASRAVDVASIVSTNDGDSMKDLIKAVQNAMIGSIPEGIAIPKVVRHSAVFGENSISYVKLKLINSVRSEKEFSFSATILADNVPKMYDKIYDFFYSAYERLIIDELATRNLEKVNDVLNQATAGSGIDYRIKVISSLGNEGKKIAYMSDDEIVFVADDDNVFALDEVIVLFDEPNGLISEEIIQSHYDALVDELSTAQTPVRLVNIHGGVLVSYICGMSKRVKPMTYIKKVCNRNIMKLNSNKGAMGYYYVDNIFSLVYRSKDGEYEVVLSPFDVGTLCNVDVDVVSKIKGVKG